MSDQQYPKGHRPPTWFQAPGPRAGRLGRAGRRTVISVVVAAFALSIVAASAGRPPAQIPSSGAERFVAPDGHRTILIGTSPAESGTAQVRQTGHQPGSRAWVDGPWWFYVGLPDLDFANRNYWVVETEDDSGGDTPHLLRLDRTGLATQVEGWPEIRSFEPARPEVPANPRAGQRVTTTGHTRTIPDAAGVPTPNAAGLPTPDAGGVTAAYTSVLQVEDAGSIGRDCLEFRRTDTIGDAAPVISSRVRCPQRGVVRLDLPAGRWDAAARWPAWDDPRRTVNLVEPPPGPLRGLAPSPIEFLRGELPAVVSADGPLLSTGDSYLLAARATGNLLWLTRGRDRFEVTAWVDAGGDLAGVAECGDVIVAATSRRTLIAHDEAGRWLWTTELADVVGSDPVRAGNSLFAATKDGRLQAMGCADGIVRWVADGIGSTVSPAVGAAGILVAGEGGVRLFNPETGEQRWERELPGQPRALGFLGSLAVVADSEDYIHALSESDGAPVWSHRLASTVAELHGLEDLVAVRTENGFVGIDRDGQRRWQHPFEAMESLSDGQHVFAADVHGIVVIDAAGRTLERTDGALHPSSAELHLARTPTGVTATDSLGTLIDWRPA